MSKVVAEEIPEHFHLLVDYPLSYKVAGKKAKTIYPDITIIKNTSIVGIIEFKTDLGYLSKDWTEKNLSVFEALIKAKNIKYNKFVGTPKAEANLLTVSEVLNRCVVVLTKENDHNRMAEFQKNNNCFILCGGPHPNSYKLDTKSIELEIMKSENDWEKFILYLKKTFY